MMMKTKVFISRELDGLSPFRSALDSEKYIIQDISLITFSPLEFVDTSSDWLFFYSKSGVRFYLDHHHDLSNRKVATFGPSTGAFFTHKTGLTVDFVGSGRKHEVASDFGDIVGRKECTFVIGKNSLRSVQKLLPDINANEIVVYDNSPLEVFEITYPDIAVFTSPMSVYAYFKKYPNRDHQNIPIGLTTGEAITECKKEVTLLPSQPTEQALALAVQGLICT